MGQKKTHFPPSHRNQAANPATIFPGKFFKDFFLLVLHKNTISPGTNSAARVGGCRANLRFFLGFCPVALPFLVLRWVFFFFSKIAPFFFLFFTCPRPG